LVLKAIRASSIHRRLVVAVMLLSWLVITNHCALSRLSSVAVTNGEHAHCHPAQDSGSKKMPADDSRECCRAIKASLPDNAVSKFDVAQIHLQVWVVLQVIGEPKRPALVEFIHDHGPPQADSFAEIVLQSCLRSHAPPAFV
jgi:hypothetical protein